jgi:thymidylate synthase
MRIFKNCKEMDSEVHRDLFEMGVKVTPKTMQDKTVAGLKSYETLELSGYSFAIESTKDIDALIKKRNLNLEWCYADLEERLSKDRVNPGKAYKLRREWAEFIHNGEFAYTYNERLRYQVDLTIKLLNFDNNTRQGVITVYEGAKDASNRGGIKRVPCSMYYQFLVRKGKLNVIYTMRSSDFMTHFPYDIWMAAKLRDHIAERIKVKSGRLIFFSGSLHAYRKDIPETF